MTCGDKCLKLTAERSEEVNELEMVQEETHTSLHSKHAAADYDSIIIIGAGNTDVLISMAVQARTGLSFT